MSLLPTLALASIAFNRPNVIAEQIRLLKKYLLDPFELTVFDNSSDDSAAEEISRRCVEEKTGYQRLTSRLHHEGLNVAGKEFLAGNTAYLGFLDHDIFPTRPTRLVPLIEKAGFYGVGQRHPATGRLYLWPGFCFFSRTWLADRPLDFSGLRDGDSRNDGDTGSCLWQLFADEDWKLLYRAEHSYQVVRKPDGHGLQSWGVEKIDDWLHLSNASDWMIVPKPKEREKILAEMLAAL